MTGGRSRGSTARRRARPSRSLADRIARCALRRADATRGAVGVHVGSHRGRPRASPRPRRSRPTATSRRSPTAGRADPRAAGGRLRRRARGVQEHRRSRGGLATRRRERPDAVLVIVGKGLAAARRRRPPARPARPGRVSPRAAPRRGRGASSTPRRCSSCPRGPRDSAGSFIEAFARGRGVVATGAGGVLDLVEDGVEGISIPPGDTDALVAATRRACSSDRELAERLGAAAHERYADWHPTAEDFARQIASSSTDVLAGAR